MLWGYLVFLISYVLKSKYYIIGVVRIIFYRHLYLIGIYISSNCTDLGSFFLRLFFYQLYLHLDTKLQTDWFSFFRYVYSTISAIFKESRKWSFRVKFRYLQFSPVNITQAKTLRQHLNDIRINSQSQFCDNEVSWDISCVSLL